MQQHHIGWLKIARLGLVQTALGAIVVLTTSTFNRVMVVELALPAMLPGILVAAHYAIQFLRPRLGHGSDVGGRRTLWIIGGMIVLGVSAFLAALATALMASHLIGGVFLALIAFLGIGAGVGASGTSLLALLAERVAPERRPAAATLVWLMMIAGMAITAGIVGKLLDPFSVGLMVIITGSVAVLAVVVTCIAVLNVERDVAPTPASTSPVEQNFRTALQSVWSDTHARRFTFFVFISMLAYSGQDLVLEPFAGHVFGMSPGQSTSLAGIQHGGVFVGMLLVALAGSGLSFGRSIPLRIWAVGGCTLSAVALLGLVIAGFVGLSWPLKANVFFLGLANGAFAVAAIACMMALAGSAGPRKEGIRMGLWGAAQAVAFGLGGFLGTVVVDVTRYVVGSPNEAYALVFAIEAVLFVISARLASSIVTDKISKQKNVSDSRTVLRTAEGTV